MDAAELLVCQALQAATDMNHEMVQKAEAQLRDWELQVGFFPTLARISMNMNGQLDANVRWMAAVYLKNGIDKYWRRNTRHELPAEQKQQIRDTLLQFFSSEQVPQVALQVAVLMSRIARIDCPRDWPQLLPELLKRIETGETTNPVEHLRVLLVLHYVIKALASRRMMAEKRAFEELTTNIYAYILQLSDTHNAQFFEQLKTAPAETLLDTLERALLIARILRKLSVYGFGKTHKYPDCLRYVGQLFQRLRQCLECRYELRRHQQQQQQQQLQLDTDSPLVCMLEKYILKQLKTLNEFRDMHAEAFARFVPIALEFSFHYVFHEGTQLIYDDNTINFSLFAIQCINLMKGIMMCESYTAHDSADNVVAIASNGDGDGDEPAAVNAHVALCEFFSTERLRYMCDRMLTHYFLLTQQELETWQADPESFAQDDGGESWKYALRPCIENLYLTCFAQYQAEMTTEVVKYVRRAQQLEIGADAELKHILLKDAIYNAAGLASFHFFHEIDFPTWFSGQLLAELRVDCSNFRILRRRIIWLLGEWVVVKFAREMRPLAYEACLHLLRANEDMSIRLAASRTLSTLIDDFEFAPVPFRPYFEAAFNSLFMLLGEAQECDTKMNVLTIMSLIVDKMSDYIEPQAEQLISYLPLLWKESENYNMLRCSIICTLQQLVEAMRDIPDAMKPFLYSVINLSTDLEQPSHVYLMEEGLTLWLAFVENSTALTPELLDLCQHLLPIIEMSTENLRTILTLIQAYVLLDAQSFLTRYGSQFVDYCLRTFDDIRAEGIIFMLKVFETCLKSDSNFGLNLVRPALPYIFKQVYLNKDFPMLMSMYLMMVARTLLIDQSVFMAVIQEIQQPNALETILDVWISKMPLVTEVEKRKLFSLAFGSIFSNNQLLLQRFPAIMQNINETLIDVMREDIDAVDYQQLSDDSESPSSTQQQAACASGSGSSHAPIRYIDSLVFQDEQELDASIYGTMDDFDYKTYHYDRCRQLSLRDPIHKIVLTEYLEWQLNLLRQQLGDEAYQQLLKTVYPEVLEKIMMFIEQTTKKADAAKRQSFVVCKCV